MLKVNSALMAVIIAAGGLSGTSHARQMSEAEEKAALAELWFDLAELSMDLEGGTLSTLESFENACTYDHPEGCRQAGYLLFFGGKIDPDPLRGTGFYEKGCDLGDVGACVAAGFVYATEDDGVPTDADKSRTYYSRGCDLGDDFACNRLGE